MLEGLGGEEDEEDQDTIKEAFLETSPYLLALTIIVSLLHSVFEFLAFKNGKVLFWLYICFQIYLLSSRT